MLTNLSYSEQERLAYMAGDYSAAAAASALGHLEDVGTPRAYIEEAKAQFPNEDALQEHIDALRTLAKRMRGDNRAELESIVAELEEKHDQQGLSTGYGLEQLDKAIESLDAMGA